MRPEHGRSRVQSQYNTEERVRARFQYSLENPCRCECACGGPSRYMLTEGTRCANQIAQDRRERAPGGDLALLYASMHDCHI